MSNNRRALVGQLHALGLSHDEAKIYIELLNGPSSHMKLAQATGVNRTKVYRLAEELKSWRAASSSLSVSTTGVWRW